MNCTDLHFSIFDIISFIEHAYIDAKFHHKESQYLLIYLLSTGTYSSREIVKFDFIYLFWCEFSPHDFIFSDFIFRDLCKKTLPYRIFLMIFIKMNFSVILENYFWVFLFKLLSHTSELNSFIPSDSAWYMQFQSPSMSKGLK